MVDLSSIIVRPGAEELIQTLQQANIHVAVWSSATRENTNSMINALLPQPNGLVFVMDQSHCHYHVEQRHESNAAKDVAKVFGNTDDVNPRGGYTKVLC